MQQASNRQMTNTRWVKIGIIGKANGLLGAFFVSGRELPIEKSVRYVRIGISFEKSQTYKVSQSRMQSKRPVISCEEITTRDQADLIKGQELWCERNSLSVNSDEYLWDDIIGKAVKDCNGLLIGHVESMVNHGASDIVEISNQEGHKLSIPFVSAYFDMSFDTSAKHLDLTVEQDVFADAWELSGEKA